MLLFRSDEDGDTYYSRIDEAKSSLPGFFPYDFLAVDLLVQAFTDARDDDFKQAISTGEYGNRYQKIIADLAQILGDKKANLDLDLGGVNFTKIDEIGTKIKLYPSDLSQRRIKNKIVILCEGGRYDGKERLSPQSYRRMEELPDANFYHACIPSYWRERRPQFFNCGDRHDTLSTYFKLLELYVREPELSYLSPELLFALVDIDLHTAKIEDEEYGFADTEEIFHDLYLNLKIQPDKLPQHRIWVTGLMHKEAYFINPALQTIFDKYEIQIEYREKPIDLNSIYQDIIKDLERGPDLCQHFTKAVKRICHCDKLNLQNSQLLAKSWQKSSDFTEKVETELIFALLAIAKSKPYWQKVMASSPARQREALSLQIARRFYAEQSGEDYDRYHLPCFFTYLYNL